MLSAQRSTDLANQSLSVEATLMALQEQINQLHCINSDNSVDWLLVERLAADLLNSGVKHFQAMAYWGVSRLHNQGFTALAAAAEPLTQWVTHHWEQALPPVKRLRGRLSAIEWWLEHATAWIQQAGCGPLAATDYEQAVAAVTAFDRALAAQCESSPVMAPLISALKQLEVIQPLPEAPEKEREDEAVQAVPIDTERPVIELVVSEHPAAHQIDPGVAGEPTLATHAAPAAVAGATVAADPPVETADLWELSILDQPPATTHRQTVIERALQAMAADDYPQAIELLQQDQQQLLGAERLRRTCQLADCLRKTGCVTLASVQIQQALALVKQHHLESWDPPLAQQVLECAFDLLNTLGNSEEATEILGRLCLLDAGRAFRKLSTA